MPHPPRRPLRPLQSTTISQAADQHPGGAQREIEPPTARSVAWCSASIWSDPDGSGLLTSDGSSVQTDREGPRRIVWMSKRMIKQGSQFGRASPMTASEDLPRACGSSRLMLDDH